MCPWLRRILFFALKYLISFPPSKSSPGWTIPALSAWQIFQSPNLLSGPSLDSFQVHIFPVLLSPELNTALQMCPHQCWVEGNNHFSWPAGNAFLMQPKTNVNICADSFSLSSSRIHMSFFVKLFFSHLVSSAALVRGVVSPRVQNLALPSVELHQISVSPFSGLSRSLWISGYKIEVNSAPITQVFQEDAKQHWSYRL